MNRHLFVTSICCTFIIFAQIHLKAIPSSFNVQDSLNSLADYDNSADEFPHCVVADPFQRQSHADFTQLSKTSLFKHSRKLQDLPPLPSLNEQEANQEAKRLVVLLKKLDPKSIIYTAQRDEGWVQLARDEIEKSGPPIKRAQILTVIDRNSKVQELCFVLAFPKGEGQWVALGGGHVSTGTKNRKLYYITPTGVFFNTTERIGYRALGTKNKNGIRGNGVKGMRVWDFGWQWAKKGWLDKGEKGQIRLEMHATDPAYLESRLGHSASEGCVRISAAMNRFIDYYGLMDVLYNQASAKDIRFRTVLLKDREPSPIAGAILVIVDSSDTSNS